MNPQENTDSSNNKKNDTKHSFPKKAIDGMGSSISAIKQVRKAHQLSTKATHELKTLTKQIETLEKTLEHRRHVVENFSDICEEQSHIAAAAQNDLDTADTELEKLTQEKQRLQEELATMKRTHEDEKRPYENLARTTQGRSEDARRSLDDARRNVKSAAQQVDEIKEQRGARLTTTNKALDNASKRIAQLRDELNTLVEQNPENTRAIRHTEEQIAHENEIIADAKRDIERISSEFTDRIESAQTHLWTAQKTLEIEQNQYDQTHGEALARKQELDELEHNHMTKEATLDNDIVDIDMKIREFTKTQTASEKRLQEAQDAISEAKSIRATPEKTQAIADKLFDLKALHEKKEQDVKQLEQAEKHLRTKTRKQRTLFFVLLALVLVIVCMLVLFALGFIQ